MSDETLQALEDWKGGHKSRDVKIEIDDGYGATCWRVDLRGHGKKVHATEVSFYEYDPAKLPPDVVVAMPQDGDDWPGLIATIQAALKRAEELGL